MATNAKRFVKRFQNRFKLRAQVSGVNTLLRRQLFRQRHHLFSGGLECAGVGQTGTQPQRPLTQSVAQLNPHPGDFAFRRRAEQIIHMIVAQRGMANQRADVQ